MSNHTKLCLRERELLARWKNEGLSNKKCARRLGRHPSTIGRELKRNQYYCHNQYQQLVGVYVPLHAQYLAQTRQQQVSLSKHPLKNSKVFRYVIEHLIRGWSPEQIAGRLRLEHPLDSSWHICHETIYRFIYHPQQKHRRWWEYLRRKQKKRRKKKGRKCHRSRIPDRVSIHQRPIMIDERKEFGHWEGDSVVGKGKTNGLHTEYERVSSLIRFERLNHINAKETKKAWQKIFVNLPIKARRSSTFDNGTEMVEHTWLNKELNMKTYFADPYSSWQRGGNENANLWIRYYFPKGTDFSKISDEELKAVEQELNNRPRKRLGFKTPQEVFEEYLRGCDRC